MKAVLWPRYGSPDVLNVADIDMPVPNDNEILIKTHAATVTAGDCELRRFQIAGWIWLPVRFMVGIRRPKPKALGQEVAGEVITTGTNVKDFKSGDKIFSETGLSLGAYAEYTLLSNKRVMAHKPSSLSYEQVATIPTGGINALHFVRKSNIKKNDKVLINGAGGSIGTYAIQLAKMHGAEITAIDSGEKLEMLKRLGAKEVIDFQKEDFTQKGLKWDVIIDVVGIKSYSKTIKCLTKGGRLILGNPDLGGMLRGLITSKTTSKRVISQLASYKKEDLDYLKELIEDGKILVEIDKRYPLDQLADAHYYVDAGKKKGNVIIDVGNCREN